MVVEILTKNNDNDDNRDSEPITFKGFIVQALDPKTLKFIGRFMPGEGLNMMAECSAVTHQNNRLKTSATFLWMPPDDRNFGEVIFRYDQLVDLLLPSIIHFVVFYRATIVKEKQTYYHNMIAEVIED